MRSRQIAQRLGVEEAHMLDFQQFTAAWDDKMKEYEERATELLEAMRQRHMLDYNDFRSKAEAEPQRKPKFSKVREPSLLPSSRAPVPAHLSPLALALASTPLFLPPQVEPPPFPPAPALHSPGPSLRLHRPRFPPAAGASGLAQDRGDAGQAVRVRRGAEGQGLRR